MIFNSEEAMKFILGCNYWASNAGADMWRDFDEKAIREDIRVLSSYGVSCMRVFPNWRDFQPVMPLYGGRGILHGYCLEGERDAENPYFLDEVMLSRFELFLDICDEYNIKVIVGLVTGWMSGRLYIPSALYGKNVLTDPEALYFEHLFIRGFVSRFKSRRAIYAWDLGNECNCMADASRIQAVNWTATIANAIRAEDPTRAVVSGMHGLEVDPVSVWQIKDQALWNDILTTHPYPYWCLHTRNDDTLSLRTLMHATAQNKYYSECGGKPCMAEEIGTMGPMLASDEASAKFLRTNLFSLWANGSAGLMWWCAHEQTMLSAFPYSTNMVEVELGLLNADRSPKPTMLEIKKFADFLANVGIELPPARVDAVCLLTHGQRQWGVLYCTYILARKAGINLRFCYADDGIPDADTYLLPSVNGITVMNSKHYGELRERVYGGASLYISMDNGVLSEFERLTGMRIVDSHESPEQRSFTLGGERFDFHRKRSYILESVGADVIARDDKNDPVISVYNYGNGRVSYLNFPLEENLIDAHNAFDGNDFELYRYAFGSLIDSQPVRIIGEGVYTTLHEKDGTVYAMAINYTDKCADIEIICENYKLERAVYGDAQKVMPYDAVLLEFKKSF